jgi:hypothetical protein
VIRLSDRLPADQTAWLHHVTEVGEYGLALEDMAGMLAYDKIAITDQERGDMLALARQMGMGELVPSALKSCAPAEGFRTSGHRCAPPP